MENKWNLRMMRLVHCRLCFNYQLSLFCCIRKQNKKNIIFDRLNSRLNNYSPQQILNQKLTEPSMLGYGLKKRFPDETSDEIVSRLQGLCEIK